MKYIVTKNENGKEELFTFPNHVHHDCMAEVLCYIKNQMYGNWEREYREPISAGFIDSKGNCYGISESLGLASRPEIDTALFRSQ